jgi:hypothetical protein
MKPLLPALALALACAAASASACGDSSGDALVIVQETNVDTGTCESEHQEVRDTVRTCDAREVTVVICTDEPLCEAQIQEIISLVQSCEEPSEEFRTEPTADC